MPFIILILTVVGGAIWWWIRSNPRDALDMAVDTATTLKNAPRRYAFKRKSNRHPVETIEEPEVAIATIVQAFLRLDQMPTKEAQDQAAQALRRAYNLDLPELEELLVLGNWLANQCQSPSAAISRVSRKLKKINGDTIYDTLSSILSDALKNQDLSAGQQNALEDIKITFRR